METWLAIIIGMLIVIVGVPTLIFLVILIVGAGCKTFMRCKYDASSKNVVDCIARLKELGCNVSDIEYSGDYEKYVISRRRDSNDSGN